MDYLKEVEAFEQWLETNPLNPSSQLLWYKLVSIFNRCGWEEWIAVDNLRLMSLTGIKREATFIKIRNKLIQNRLIKYEKGVKGSPSKYKLVSFEDKNTFKNEVKSVAKSEVNNAVKSVANNAVKSVENNYTIPDAEIVQLFNNICVSFKPVLKLTTKRKQAIGARWRENDCDIKIFEKVFRNAQESDFLKSNSWADFDWILRPTNFIKVLEGKYSNFDSNIINSNNNNIKNKEKQNKEKLEQLRRLKDGAISE